jgi:hypothetical protein
VRLADFFVAMNDADLFDVAIATTEVMEKPAEATGVGKTPLQNHVAELSEAAKAFWKPWSSNQ